jgi:type II secretory pathway pseudopilin PulG
MTLFDSAGRVEIVVASPRRPRGGFTIVELLVVASIMAALFGLVLAGARPNVGGELRRAAQQFASVLLAAQSRAIGDPRGSAVVLESTGLSCITVLAGEKPPFVVATVSGMPPVDPAALNAAVSLSPTNGGDLQRGYRIQFFGNVSSLPPSAWFGFQPPGTVLRRSEDGQSAANTVWPAISGTQMRARVACYPTKGTMAMQFPKAIGIDLRYSGTGDDPTTAWGGLAAKGDIGVSFDTVGTIDALMRGLDTALAAARQPVEPIYFLIATRADINADQALANDRSLWVVLQPQTGRVTVSSNVGQSAKDRVALRAARTTARAALTAGK